jgi:hypothetical protein
MGDVTKLGFLHSLQHLFGFGGDKPKPSQAATEPKKNRPSHAPKHTASGQGYAQQVSSSEKPAKKALPFGAKKVTAKPKHGTKFQGPPPAAPAEAPGEIPPHERPAADRQQKSSEEKGAPSIYNPPAPDRKIEPGVKSAPPSVAAAPPGQLPPEDVPPAKRKTGKPGASSRSPA